MRIRSRAGAVSVLGASLVFGLAGCGGSSSTEPTPPPATSESASATSESAQGVDVCATVSSSEVAKILGVPIVASKPINGDLTSCQYMINVGATDPMQLTVVQIQMYPTSFFDGQKEIQTAAKSISGVGVSAIELATGAILAKNDTTAVMVSPGVELKAGGKVANKAQLSAITVLALKTS